MKTTIAQRKRASLWTYLSAQKNNKKNATSASLSLKGQGKKWLLDHRLHLTKHYRMAT